MRHFILSLVLLLLASRLPAGYEWKQLNDNPAWWALYADGRGLGAWSSESGVYRPWFGGENYGEAANAPCSPPFTNDRDVLDDNGVLRILRPGIHYGGEGSRTLDNLVGVEKTPNIPAFEKMPSFTVVSVDRKIAEKVVLT